MDDRELLVKEQELLNRKKYKIEKADFFVSGKNKENMNRKIKRQSKKVKEQQAYLWKQEATAARKK